MGDIRDVAEALGRLQSFVICAHVNPDGDAVGSSIGLALALTKLGKKVSVINTFPVPEFLMFLPGAELFRQVESIDEAYDALVVLDCEPDRTGLKNLDTAPVGTVINIDHHITNKRLCAVNWVNPDAAATGEMVYDIIVEMGIQIDLDIATSLYTCIFTDTGSFRYSNTDGDSLRKSATLLEYGVDTWEIAENVYETKSFNRMKLLGLVLATVQQSPDTRLSWVQVREEFYDQTGTSAEDTDGFINYPRAVKGTEVAVLFREEGDKVKISFRSKGRVDVSALASELGGGGHPNASGAVMNCSLTDAMAMVLPKSMERVSAALSGKV